MSRGRFRSMRRPVAHHRRRYLALAFAGATFACSHRPAATTADTMSDAAAAESAKAFARMSTAHHTHVAVTASGARSYDGPMNVRATCTYGSAGNGEPMVQVEGFARDATISFAIIAPHEGSVIVTTLGHHGARIANLDIAIRGHHYADGGGRATLTDPLGRAGSLTASGFSDIDRPHGVGHRTRLSVHATWECA